MLDRLTITVHESGAPTDVDCLPRIVGGICDYADVDARQFRSYRVVGLFAGIAGLESGLHAAGHFTVMLCEVWSPARAVLAAHFPSIPMEEDVRTLQSLPEDVEVVAAGFPCTDLSQAGRTRLVDSRFTGLPQRRQRVLLVASKTEDPRGVLLADDAGEPDPQRRFNDRHTVSPRHLDPGSSDRSATGHAVDRGCRGAAGICTRLDRGRGVSGPQELKVEARR